MDYRNKNLVVLGAMLFSLAPLAHAKGDAAQQTQQAQQTQCQKSTHPLVTLCTDGPIPETGKESVNGHIHWQDSDHGEAPSCDDTTGWQAVTVQYRGHSSLKFPKKQYGINFIDADGDSMKGSLGDFPKASKFAFRTTYVDRSFLRDAFTYELGRRIGESRGDHYGAPRTELVEIVENGTYQGIYVLAEKVARSKHTVPLDKFNPDNIRDLTYILEFSAGHNMYSFKTDHGTMIKYVDPSEHKLEKLKKENFLKFSIVQEEIKQQLRVLEDALSGKNFKDPVDGYRPMVDMPSFVDYFIVQELTKNVDGFRRSAYFYRAEDGKFHMGPLWDFDVAMGNLDFYTMAKPTGWSHTKPWIILPNSFWFNRMLQDPYFADAIKTRYFELRERGNLLDWDVLEKELDTLDTKLGSSPDKDQCRWAGTQNFIVRHIMNTHATSKTHEGNVEILKQWIQDRLKWLDKKIAEEKF